MQPWDPSRLTLQGWDNTQVKEVEGNKIEDFSVFSLISSFVLIFSVESPDSITTHKELLSPFGDSLPWSLWPEVEQISLCLKSNPNGLFIGDTDTDFFFVFVEARKKGKTVLVNYLRHIEISVYMLWKQIFAYIQKEERNSKRQSLWITYDRYRFLCQYLS